MSDRTGTAMMLALALTLASCNADTESTTTTTASVASTSTSSTTTTTTTSTTSTLAITTTSLSTSPSPRQLRQEFLDGLVGEGWLRYEDPDGLGWSISYPPDWTILPNTSDKNAAFQSPGGGQLIVLHAPSPGGANTSSTFLAAQLGAASEAAIAESVGDVTQLVITIPLEVDDCRRLEECRSWFLDINYANDLGELPDEQDIVGVQVTLLVDPWNFEPVSSPSAEKSWWYAYYDPTSTQDVAFLLFTYMHDATFESVVDDIVRSFEPPEGYPHVGG